MHRKSLILDQGLEGSLPDTIADGLLLTANGGTGGNTRSSNLNSKKGAKIVKAASLGSHDKKENLAMKCLAYFRRLSATLRQLLQTGVIMIDDETAKAFGYILLLLDRIFRRSMEFAEKHRVAEEPVNAADKGERSASADQQRTWARPPMSRRRPVADAEAIRDRRQSRRRRF